MERNVMGELSMHRAAGTKPNFSDIARRHGLDRHTVAKYWRRAARWRTAGPTERARSSACGRSSRRRPSCPGDEEGGARDAAAPAQRPAAAGLRGVHRVVPQAGGRLRCPVAGGAPALRDAAGPPAAVRLEGGRQARRRERRGLRVQRVVGHARALPQAPLHTHEDEDHGRPARVPAGRLPDLRRHPRGVRHRQHVGPRGLLRGQEAEGRARVEVRRGGGLPGSCSAAPGRRRRRARTRARTASSPGSAPTRASSPAGRASSSASRA